MSEYLGVDCPMRITGVVEEEKKAMFISTGRVNRVTHRPYSKDEDNQLILLSKDHAYSEIALVMNRSKDSIAQRYDKLYRSGKAPKKPFIYAKKQGC